MKKYVLNVLLPNTNNAMNKAKSDITKILEDKNFSAINVELFKNKIEKLFSNQKKLAQFNLIQKDDVLVIQYPTYLGRFFENLLFKYLKKREVKVIGLIHDIDTLRFISKEKKGLEREFKVYKNFDAIVSSNYRMTKLIKKYKYDGPIVDLDIFDYLVASNKTNSNICSDKYIVNFAGNLDKSKFISSLHSDKIKYQLFGNLQSPSVLDKSVKYFGTFSPEDVPNQLINGFGLVWDGDTIETNGGLLGEYELYNNPHKLSLYLVSGLPVIVWKKAAIARFVINNNVGIVVDSLAELEDTLSQLSTADYQNLCINTKKVADKLRQGFYTQKAVEKAEADL